VGNRSFPFRAHHTGRADLSLISLRLDRSVIEAFKSEGPGWQRRINEALKSAAGR